MRRILPLALAVFLVVGAALYCVSWYLQAKTAKDTIEQAIAQINAKQPYITYQSIEISGFPTQVRVNIVNPVFSGRIDTLMKTIGGDLPVMPDGSDGEKVKDALMRMPEWTERFSLDGTVEIGVNAFSSRYSMTIKGPVLNESVIGSDKRSLRMIQKTDRTCEITLRSQGGFLGNMWNLQGMTIDRVLKEASSLVCSGGENVIADAATNETLMQSGPVFFTITRLWPAAGKMAVDVKLDIADSESLPPADAWVARYFTLFIPDEPLPPSLRISAYGKQNMHLDAGWKGPEDINTLGLNTPVDFEIRRMDISNALYQSSTTLHIANAEAVNGIYAALLKFRAESTVSEAYDTILADIFRRDIASMQEQEQMLAVNPQIRRYSPEQLYDMFAPLIPKLHPLGKITFALDSAYRGDASMNNGEVTLNNMEISVAPYGVTASGKSTKTPEQPFPVGTLNLACRNCMALVEDTGAWLRKLKAALSPLNPDIAASINADPALVEGIKRFLQAIGKAEGDTLRYGISVASPQDITINEKPMDDVLALYAQYIHPQLQPNTRGEPNAH